MNVVLDILTAGIAALILMPVALVIALVIRWRLGSPVLFRQTRTGLQGQVFTMYKFRTMREDRAADGNLLPDEDRLTPLGRFLRTTSLDELPEFLNILKGDMRLVGPRPLLPEYLPLYTKEQMRRHDVKPGITGWAQVNGRNALGWEEKFALDVWYVDHRSWWLDIRILLMTVAQVFSRKGVCADGHATMPRFQGSAPPDGGGG